MRLGELIPRVRKAYDDFEFHTIFHALNNFCSVDMSAVYLDILKDRLYTFDKDSPLRRSSQTVLFDIVVALTKLMAPILSFTAEEIWQVLPEVIRKDSKASAFIWRCFRMLNPNGRILSWLNAGNDYSKCE